MRVLRSRKRVLAFTAIPVLILAIWAITSLGKKDQTQYQTSTVEKGMIISSISASGQVSSANDIPLTTQATGVVKAVYVKDGDMVKAGDKILEIKLDSNGRKTKAQAWSSYLAAKSAVESAVGNQLQAKKDASTSGNDVTAANQNKLQSLQSIQQAQAQLESAQTSWNKAQDSSTSESDKQQKLLSLESAQTALALAQLKYNDSDSNAAKTNSQNLLQLQQGLQQTQSALMQAQNAYDQASDATQTTTEELQSKFYALQAAQTALSLAQQKYDDAAAGDTSSTEQSKLQLQRDIQQAEAALIQAQAAYKDVQDPSNSESDKKQKLYALEVAQTALTLAQQKFNSAGADIASASYSGPIAKQKAKSSNTALLKAQADLSSALETYQATLGMVVAPADGKISDLMVTEGMVISSSSSSSSSGSSSSSSGQGSSSGSSSSSSSGSSSSGGQTVAHLSIDSNPIASVNLTEIDISKVKVGQKVTLTLDAFTDKTFTGKVLGINRSGSVSSGVTNYPVSIVFDTLDENILPNMAASANIITETKDNVLLVPVGAVKTSNGASTVQVLKNNKTQDVTVETGISSDSQIEVASGLTEGQTIVTATISTATQAASSSSGSSPFSGSFGNRSSGGGSNSSGSSTNRSGSSSGALGGGMGGPPGGGPGGF
ncbi:MAG TPA: HlyD family efflux transporter periplasmic adaptor subunit [Candidatus Aquicultor sp.]